MEIAISWTSLTGCVTATGSVAVFSALFFMGFFAGALAITGGAEMASLDRAACGAFSAVFLDVFAVSFFAISGGFATRSAFFVAEGLAVFSRFGAFFKTLF